MTDLPLHPAIVHVPLGLAFVMPLVAIGVWLAVRRGRLPRSAFAVVAALQLVVAGAGFAAMAAGDREAKRVASVVGKDVVETHEDRAEAFVWTAAAVAAVSIALLFVPDRFVTAGAALTAAGTLAVVALAYATGEAGGEIVYRRGGAAVYANGAPPPAAARGAQARHDRDHDGDRD